jgi:hypothetical protein
LGFVYKQDSTITVNGKKATIKNLLKEIKIPTTKEQRDSDKLSNINLLNLFYVEKEVTDKVDDENKIDLLYLTRAAHHGLSLPARSVLDLWQLLDWLVHDTFSERDFRAEKVARMMLRCAISCSDMPNAVAQDLQTYILRRGERHGTILYFANDISLNVIPITSANNDFEHTLTPVFSKVTKLSSRLEVCNIEDIVLELRFDPPIEQLDSSKNQYPQPFVMENSHDNEKRRIELPPLVAAWLMVLYDILVLAEATASSWVMGHAANNNYRHVSVHHFAIRAGKKRNIELLGWNPPIWNVFWGRNIFSLCWKNFREKILKLKLKALQDGDSVTKLLAAGWIFCVLKTSVELISSIDGFQLEKDDDTEEQKKAQGFNLPNLSKCVLANTENKGNEFEENVMQAAGRFYQLIQYSKSYQLTQEQADKKEDKIISAAYEIMLATEKWLKTEFIYFLNYAYVPIESGNSKKRFNHIWRVLSKEEDTLTNRWKENSAFILAAIEERFTEAEDTDNSNIEIIKETTTETIGNITKETIKETTRKTIEPLSKLLFADLYEQLEKSKTASEQ